LALPLPKYKEIMELIKKGATLEAQEKIMELRESALELQDQNLEQKAEIRALKKELVQIKEFRGELCPSCKRSGWYIKSSKNDPIFGDLGGSRRIYACKFCDFTEEKIV